MSMCQYFSNTEDRCSQAMKQAAKDVFENNMHHNDTIACLSNRERSVQESVYHIPPEMKLRRIFPVVYFVNTNSPEERVQALLSEKELSKLSDDSPNIYEKLIAIWKDQVQHSAMENKVY